MSQETNNQIYASIEDSLRLKEAGFDKPTFFLHHFEPNGNWVVKTKQILYSSLVAILPESVLQAPTLGEIDLPEMVVIMKEFAKYKATSSDFVLRQKLSIDMLHGNEFENELQARIEAWLWAKQNNLL